MKSETISAKHVFSYTKFGRVIIRIEYFLLFSLIGLGAGLLGIWIGNLSPSFYENPVDSSTKTASVIFCMVIGGVAGLLIGGVLDSLIFWKFYNPTETSTSIYKQKRIAELQENIKNNNIDIDKLQKKNLEFEETIRKLQ